MSLQEVTAHTTFYRGFPLLNFLFISRSLWIVLLVESQVHVVLRFNIRYAFCAGMWQCFKEPRSARSLAAGTRCPP